MSDEVELTLVSIYVLPSEEGSPPRALLFEGETERRSTARYATWSTDSGTWMIEGTPVPPSLAEAITEHAKSLGIEW